MLRRAVGSILSEQAGVHFARHIFYVETAENLLICTFKFSVVEDTITCLGPTTRHHPTFFFPMPYTNSPAGSGPSYLLARPIDVT